MKEIIGYISELAKREAGECRDCLGKGCVYPNFFRPCPTCHKIRAVAKMCWHEWEEESNVDAVRACIHCGYPDWTEENFLTENYTPDIPALRKLMETVGVWEKFAGLFAYDIETEDIPYSAGERINVSSVIEVINTVTSDKFYEVVKDFLKREV